MDILNKDLRKEQSEFKIVSNETKYSGLLELINDRIKITLTFGLSQFKWCKIYSIEDLYKQSRVFLVYNSIEDILSSDQQQIKNVGQKIILSFKLPYLNKQTAFDIDLLQEQISTNDAMRDINNSIIDMQKEIQELKNSQKRQDEVIIAQKNEIDQLKNSIQQINQKLQQKALDSKILQVKDVEKIGDWIHQQQKQMQLKLVYRATTHGFLASKFYEKCSNITPTLIVVETSGSKRFGGYTDLLWKNYGGYVTSNPNKSFLFSLDLHKKYTSNETNCLSAILGSSTYFGFGGGHDFYIQDNSNTSNSCYVNSCSYGKNEGIQQFELNGGSRQFQTREIEVYQVLLN